MRIATATACLVLALAATISAQTAQRDEQQIRAQIAKIDTGQTTGGGLATKDRIFWSGAYKRPVIAPERGEEVPGDRAVSSGRKTPNATRPLRFGSRSLNQVT